VFVVEITSRPLICSNRKGKGLCFLYDFVLCRLFFTFSLNLDSGPKPKLWEG